MILSSIILFCLAATLGLWLIILGIRYHKGSLALAVTHAVLAVLGLCLLGKQVLDGPVLMLYNVATLLFVLTLLGGLVLLALRLGKHNHHSPPPMFIVSLHALMGMIAFLLLVVGYSK